MRSRLTGAARGSIEAATIEGAFAELRRKFAIRLTPIAVEAELRQTKQKNNKTITEFGQEVEKLATKLAAAHVSSGTFPIIGEDCKGLYRVCTDITRINIDIITRRADPKAA